MFVADILALTESHTVATILILLLTGVVGECFLRPRKNEAE